MRISTLICVLSIACGSLPGQSNERFVQFLPGHNGLTGDYFLAIAEDSIGFIWIAGRSGLFRYDGERFENCTHFLSHVFVRHLTVDSEGMLWVSTNSALIMLDPATEVTRSFVSDPYDSTTISDNRPEPVFEDRQGVLWVGTFDGLNRLDRESGTFTRYYADPVDGAMRNNRYYAIAQDPLDDRFLWLGSARGLQRFDRSSGHFDLIPLPERYHQEGRSGVPVEVLGLRTDPQGSVWLGLNNYNALIRYDPGGQTWHEFGVDLDRQLTPNRRRGTYDIIAKSRDQYWFSMVSAIGAFDKSNETITLLHIDESSTETPLASAVRRPMVDTRGHLWLPSLTGISRSQQPLSPGKARTGRIRLHRLTIDGRDILQPFAGSFAPIHLAFHEDSIVLGFNLINPSRPSAVTCEYRLLGRDQAWQNAAGGAVILTDLRKGGYNLELRAREPGGQWSETAVIPLAVAKAWWQRGWFILLVVALLATTGGSFVLIRRRHHRREQRMRNKYEKEMAQIQMEALRAQMNPHFLFNTMNSINHFILRNERRHASSYLTKFSRLIRLVLNLSKAELITLEEELEALTLYIQLEQLRFDEQFHYRIDIADDISSDKILMPPLLIQPYVENAIWHGLMHKEGPGLLSISVDRDGDQVCIAVQDDGIGRKAAEAFKASLGKSRSLGTHLTRNRIDLVNHLYGSKTEVEIVDLHDQDGRGIGTRVLLAIPFIESVPST
ncbi:MAG: histidine kinase [Saprospiraceae bacterium]|nr:histidine kinase [Saprospiraceae bacterium]